MGQISTKGRTFRSLSPEKACQQCRDIPGHAVL
jgi:hypothetical protein